MSKRGQPTKYTDELGRVIANAFNVKLIYTTRAMGAYALEEKIITRYSNKIMKGEWMTLDELEVSEIIMTIKQWQADQQSIMTK